MRICVYEGNKKVGFVRLVRKGQGIHLEYLASIHSEKRNASVFKDDYSLSRGMTIAQRCFPGRDMDVEV